MYPFSTKIVCEKSRDSRLENKRDSRHLETKAPSLVCLFPSNVCNPRTRFTKRGRELLDTGRSVRQPIVATRKLAFEDV